jgi:type IV pilus assembly protein PilY1
LWEAGKSLAETDSVTRTIYTWIDSDSDDVVDSGEWKAFTDANAAVIRPYLAQGTTVEAEALINYIRGQDQAGFRSRTIEVDGTNRVWKLGDIVHSTPTAVGKPKETYDLIYGDTSYSSFKSQYVNRRNVIYVGSNEGMLHAFNGGFYDEGNLEFELGTSIPSYRTAVPSLGEELWAYIPYNLLPHLRWLADEAYTHVYYVDLKPKVVDAKIFADDATHPGGWGTVLVCGMRFGGGELALSETEVNYDWNGNGAIEAGVIKTFRSAYFALDITDPEAAPALLWEFTDANVGFTNSYPAVAYVGSSAWALAFGSGPTAYDGTSTQTASTYILNLASGTLIGSALTTSGGNAFMGDPISVDTNISASQCSGGSCSYTSDIVYVGNSEGKFYHIRDITAASSGTASVLLDLNDNTKPIIAAPSASMDDDGRFWLYFGTGRFIGEADKVSTDDQVLVGVKEPIDFTTGNYTYAEVDSANLLNVSNYTVFEHGYIDTDGNLANYETTFDAVVDDIEQYASEAAPPDYDGWIVDLTGGERCITKPTVLGGIITFTTFEPDDDICSYEGDSFLHALYYKTGTAYFENVIGYGDDTLTVGADTFVEISRYVSLGHGISASPSLHVGSGQGTKAFVQSSTGAITGLDEQNLPEAYKSRPLHWVQQGD